ncbi:MAG TPA: hypothetical protein DCZ10_19620 [Pelotomaculum sp.]|nr:hypothetical protein [Pelotomaculum sp.]
MIYGAMHLTIKIAVNMPPKSAISQFERRYPMNLTIKRPTWKIKYISLDSPRTCTVIHLWDRLWSWLLPIGFVLVLLALCVLIGE